MSRAAQPSRQPPAISVDAGSGPGRPYFLTMAWQNDPNMPTGDAPYDYRGATPDEGWIANVFYSGDDATLSGATVLSAGAVKVNPAATSILTPPFALGVPHQSYGPAILARSPLIYWRFGQLHPLDDSSENGRNIITPGFFNVRGFGAVTDFSLPFDLDGAAETFPDTSLVMESAAYAGLNAPAAFTMICWMNAWGGTREQVTLVENGSPRAQISFDKPGDGKLRATLYNDAGGVYLEASVPTAGDGDLSTEGEFQFIAVVLRWDGTTLDLWFGIGSTVIATANVGSAVGTFTPSGTTLIRVELDGADTMAIDEVSVTPGAISNADLVTLVDDYAVWTPTREIAVGVLFGTSGSAFGGDITFAHPDLTSYVNAGYLSESDSAASVGPLFLEDYFLRVSNTALVAPLTIGFAAGVTDLAWIAVAFDNTDGQGPQGYDGPSSGSPMRTASVSLGVAFVGSMDTAPSIALPWGAHLAHVQGVL